MEKYRHGDVVIEKVDFVPTGKPIPKADGCVILAEGEVTGHAHRIDSKFAKLYPGATDAVRFLVLTKSANLTHEEHKTILLPPGTYCVTVKRQYTPEGWEKVVD